MIINGIVGHEEQDSPDLEVKNVVPSTTNQYINPDAGYDGLKGVIVEGDSNLVPENIKKGIEIFGVTGEYSDTTIRQYDLPLLNMYLKPWVWISQDDPYYFKIGEEVTKSFNSENFLQLLPPVGIGYNYYPDTIRLGTFTTVNDAGGLVNWRSDGDRVVFVNERTAKPDSGTYYFFGSYYIQRDTVEVTDTYVPDSEAKQDRSPVLPNGNYIVRISGWRITGNDSEPFYDLEWATTYKDLYAIHNAIAVANMYVRNNGNTITFGEIVTPQELKDATFYYLAVERVQTHPPSNDYLTASLGYRLSAQVFDVISFTPVNE